MKIKRMDAKEFGDVDEGQVFSDREDCVYLRIETIVDSAENSFNAVSLTDGELFLFNIAEKVFVYPNAELTL